MAGSLFEKLTLGQPGMGMSEDESIRHNLSRVLGTRQGAVQALPDYGLPDLNDLTLSRSELQNMLSSAIERLIIHYEPRLRNPQVAPYAIMEQMGFLCHEAFHIPQIRRVYPCNILSRNLHFPIPHIPKPHEQL